MSILSIFFALNELRVKVKLREAFGQLRTVVRPLEPLDHNKVELLPVSADCGRCEKSTNFIDIRKTFHCEAFQNFFEWYRNSFKSDQVLDIDSQGFRVGCSSEVDDVGMSTAFNCLPFQATPASFTPWSDTCQKHPLTLHGTSVRHASWMARNSLAMRALQLSFPVHVAQVQRSTRDDYASRRQQTWRQNDSQNCRRLRRNQP